MPSGNGPWTVSNNGDNTLGYVAAGLAVFALADAVAGVLAALAWVLWVAFGIMVTAGVGCLVFVVREFATEAHSPVPRMLPEPEREAAALTPRRSRPAVELRRVVAGQVIASKRTPRAELEPGRKVTR